MLVQSSAYCDVSTRDSCLSRQFRCYTVQHFFQWQYLSKASSLPFLVHHITAVFYHYYYSSVCTSICHRISPGEVYVRPFFILSGISSTIIDAFYLYEQLYCSRKSKDPGWATRRLAPYEIFGTSTHWSEEAGKYENAKLQNYENMSRSFD